MWANYSLPLSVCWKGLDNQYDCRKPPDVLNIPTNILTWEKSFPFCRDFLTSKCNVLHACGSFLPQTHLVAVHLIVDSVLWVLSNH